MMKAWMTFALANVAGIILHISALATIVVLWLVWKTREWCICCRQSRTSAWALPTAPPRAAP